MASASLSMTIIPKEVWRSHVAFSVFRTQVVTRHRASRPISMYSLTFCVLVVLPESHQWKPAVQAAAVMLRTPPCRRPVTGQPATRASHIRRAILKTPPSLASHRPAARADPAQTAVRTMSSYHGMDASEVKGVGFNVPLNTLYRSFRGRFLQVK